MYNKVLWKINPNFLVILFDVAIERFSNHVLNKFKRSRIFKIKIMNYKIQSQIVIEYVRKIIE